MTSASYDAVVLAGGRSRRMGGTDKTRLAVGGVSLLDRVLSVLPPDATVVVVGEERATTRPVLWTREQPLHAGPASAIASALPLVSAEVTLLLAGDLPLLTADFVASLVDATSADTGAVPVDGDGFPQWLCSAWPTSLLRRLPWTTETSLRGNLGRLPFHRLRIDGESRATAPWVDCDTPEDLQRARELS